MLLCPLKNQTDTERSDIPVFRFVLTIDGGANFVPIDCAGLPERPLKRKIQNNGFQVA